MEPEVWESEEEFIGTMIMTGAATRMYWEGGELLIDWNSEILERDYPKVFELVKEQHREQLEESLSNLVDRGLLEMSFEEKPDGGLEEVYSVTDRARQVLDIPEDFYE